MVVGSKYSGALNYPNRNKAAMSEIISRKRFHKQNENNEIAARKLILDASIFDLHFAESFKQSHSVTQVGEIARRLSRQRRKRAQELHHGFVPRFIVGACHDGEILTTAQQQGDDNKTNDAFGSWHQPEQRYVN